MRMLKARDIRFSYSQRAPWLLDGVSLDVAPSEIVGLQAPSGTGKTTFAKILAGYLKPSEGTIQVDDVSHHDRGPNPVQLLFQHPELTINPHFRIAKALSEAGQAAHQMAESLGIDRPWLSRFAHELSGGELQRVALARALVPSTRYLVADEPTTMLDAITQAEIWQLLVRVVAERGLGLLVISHDVALLKRVCHRIVPFKTGAKG
jgi:peptide/nickel transport system ATP-binding protein